MPIENPILFAITMLQDYKGDLARRDFPDNDEGDHLQRVNENKRASVDAAIAELRRHQASPDMTSTAARDVLAERNRQISAENWTPEWDDLKPDGELADAAACYALSAAGWSTYAASERWPWSKAWWKPSTPRRDLIKAGALILAEIERLDRVPVGLDSEGGSHD